MKKMKKFNKLYSLIMEQIGSGFDFLNYGKTGVSGVIEVAKSDVFAYQTVEGDEAMLNAVTSLESDYKDDARYKEIGTWICTADVPPEAGEFWLNLAGKFPKNYESAKPMDNETMTKSLKDSDSDRDVVFNHYAAKSGVTFKCIRVSEDLGETTFKGQLVQGGSFMFLNDDGTLDIYQRTDKFMQQQYHLVSDKVELTSEQKDNLQKDYKELVGEMSEQ